jgi:hypothetical protein
MSLVQVNASRDEVYLLYTCGASLDSNASGPAIIGDVRVWILLGCSIGWSHKGFAPCLAALYPCFHKAVRDQSNTAPHRLTGAFRRLRSSSDARMTPPMSSSSVRPSPTTVCVCAVRTAAPAASQPQLIEAGSAGPQTSARARTRRPSRGTARRVTSRSRKLPTRRAPAMAPRYCLWHRAFVALYGQRAGSGALNFIAVRQDASTASAATLDARGGVSHGTDERLANMEAHLGIERAPGTCAPCCVERQHGPGHYYT